MRSTTKPLELVPGYEEKFPSRPEDAVSFPYEEAYIMLTPKSAMSEARGRFHDKTGKELAAAWVHPRSHPDIAEVDGILIFADMSCVPGYIYCSHVVPGAEDK